MHTTAPITAAAPVLPACDPAVFDANLRALAGFNPRLVDRLRTTASLPEMSFLATRDDVPTAEVDGLLLASRFHPRKEAERLAETVDLLTCATIIVHGFGLGYHVEALGRRLRKTGILLVFEPDLRLLRTVLERIDHSAWIGETQLVLFDNAEDRSELAARLNGAGPIIALGTSIVEPPVSRSRLGNLATRFDEHVTKVVASMRTLLCTTLVHASTTCRNLLLNLDQYAAGPTIQPLLGIAAGRPAIVVAAGPSLARNMSLLADPQVRERHVIIAAQTVLKPLLKAGIRPHFVTALDYHEISRQFYEDLKPEDVADITLVVEPKVNRAVIDAWSGPIRVTANAFLDRVLGLWAREVGEIQSGATVAQMSFYLAQALGCDPIALVGQDLGFSEGLYYGPNAALHEIWGPELNPFNTLEMMEWQRIMRMKRTLAPTVDVHGRPMLVDEQMRTYLHEMERDFASAPQRVIDATEGGIAKQHTESMPLAEVLANFGRDALPPIPVPERTLDRARLHNVRCRIEDLAQRTRGLNALCTHTGTRIEEMLVDQKNDRRLAAHFDELDKLQQQAESMQDVIEITDQLNQLGVFKRLQADRRIAVDSDLNAFDVQRKQLERDRMNLEWLADTSEELAIILDESLAIMRGEVVCTRINTRSHRRRRSEAQEAVRADHDVNVPDVHAKVADEDVLQYIPAAQSESAAAAPDAMDADRPQRVVALLAVDPERSDLGVPRSLDIPLFGRPSVLQCTLERIDRCREIEAIVLVVERSKRSTIKNLIRSDQIRHPIIWHEIDTPLFDDAAATIAAARRFAESSWRGGIGGMSIFDEIIHPAAMHDALVAHGFDAALVIGADWPLVDWSCETGGDALIARYRENPQHFQIVFSQAPPGLNGCVVNRVRLAAMQTRDRRQTAGATLAYIPELPQIDPIGKDMCVILPNAIRTWRGRLTFDRPHRRAQLKRWSSRGLSHACEVPVKVIDQSAHALVRTGRHEEVHVPAEFFEVEICADRELSGPAAASVPCGAYEPRWMTTDAAIDHLNSIARIPGAAVIFGGFGDPLLHPEWEQIVRAARTLDIRTLGVRTDLLIDPDAIDTLLAADLDFIILRLNADGEKTYRIANGSDAFPRLTANLDRLLNGQLARTGDLRHLARPWIIPSLVRTSETIGDVQAFFDRWVYHLGAALIEPRENIGSTGSDTAQDLIEPRLPWAIEHELNARSRFVRADGMMPWTRGGWIHGPFRGRAEAILPALADDTTAGVPGELAAVPAAGL